MAKTFTYTFGTAASNITVTTSDTPQLVNTQNGTYDGYAITNVAGTFENTNITGLYGNSAGYQNSGGDDDQHDNAIFINSSQGFQGSSYDGIDGLGISLTADGGIINLSQDSAGSATIDYQFFDNDNSFAFGGYTSITSSNYKSAVCYCAGTLIRTARDGAVSDKAVEHLAVGDLAVTASGAHRAIRWIGSRLTHCRRHPRPHEAMPVRVVAHAFGPYKPARDLLVSPGHSLCVDVVGEVLIPAGSLINGTTITQEDVDRVTYWHVELEGGHDILLAENMPAESYLEMGNRAFFAESDVVALDASPDAVVATHADFCRPFHAEGALVEVVRAQLAARATRLGWRLEEQGFGDFHLIVDGVRIEPCVRGLAARFAVPKKAQSVWLVSGTSVPAEIDAGSPDRRSLGVCVAAITIDDGFGAPRAVPVDDPSLCVGYHAVERGGNAT